MGDISSGDVAAWLGAVAGFVAIVISINIARSQAKDAADAALAERKEAARRASWSAAMAAYQGYLELGVRHPELTAGGAAQLDESGRNSYAWYLSALCFAAEQVLAACDRNTNERRLWIDVLYEQFQRHQGAFAGALTEVKLNAGERFDTFSPEVQTLILGGKP